MDLALCDFEGAKWLILNSSVDPIIYYSHLSSIIISTILAFFVLFNNRKSLPNKILFFTLLSFTTWVFFALIFWASNRSDVIMLTWSIDILAESLVYIGSFYLLYILLEKKDLKFIYKLLLSLLYIPIAVLLPTQYTLSGFDVASCLAIEGPIALYYTYFVEILVTIIIISFAIYKLIQPNNSNRKEVFSITIGILLLLLAFAWGNITGSFTDDWKLGTLGLFGLPFFAGFLVYSIIKNNTFNIKIFATQALVWALWILIISILFVAQSPETNIIVGITGIIALVFGFILINSVKKEIQQREKIESLNKELERAYAVEKKANEELEKLDKVKDQFLSQVQHDLRTPLTAIMGYSDLLSSGAYGKISKKTLEVVQKIDAVALNMKKKADSFLDLVQFKLGKSGLTLKPGVELKSMLNEIVEDLQFKATSKNIQLKLNVSENISLSADLQKLKAALFNIVDNAVKYTNAGQVNVEAKKENGKVKIMIKDNGIGIPHDKLLAIFEEQFERTEQAKKTAEGKGIGLYLSSQVIKLHRGKIWAESAGEGKGSVFFIELPI